MKKISRKDISNMSTAEFMAASREPYKQLFKYILPYKSRFAIGIAFGALFGLVNGAMVWVIKFAGDQVFGAKSATEDFGEMVEKLPPDVRAESAGLVEKMQGVFAANLGEEVGLSGGIILAGIAVPLIMLLRGICSYLNTYCMTWVSLRVLRDIRSQLFRKLMGQSLEFFNKQKSGELIQTVFNQTRMAQMALTTVASDIVKQPLAVLSSIVVLFIIDWKFSLVALVLFPACIVPVIIVGKKVRKSAGKEEQEAGLLMVVMQEAFAGIRVVKSHAREEHEVEKFIDSNEKMMRSIMRWRKALEMVGPMVETVASFGVAMALIYVAMADLTAGKFLALQAGLVLMYPPAKALSRIHILLQKCLAATTKVFELMEREVDIVEAEDAVALENCQGHIEFKDVSFAYTNAGHAVSGIDLNIEPGENVALVGRSGAGKSTMLSLLMRFYDPQDGTISIDGLDIAKLKLDSLRDNIGIVSQDTFLFHDSIYENIRYGKLDATREEIERAAEQAHAHDFILEQPDGYETVIGDKGCAISGGQQQRLSIARAILRNAPILLLDEAMSALDSDAEEKVQAAIEVLAKDKTVIAIAHRLSTILEADKIVVMHEGAIQDIGTHTELLPRCEIYRGLYEKQFKSGEAVGAGSVEQEA
ncbi:MAG: ABC transporter ATP-binding protein [Verrucomicrobiota bacterium]